MSTVSCLLLLAATLVLCLATAEAAAEKPSLHFQAGGFVRMLDQDVARDKGAWLLTGDLMVSRHAPTASGWALGARLALDDHGHRLGPRVARRFALGDGGRLYLQAAGVVYVAGEDNRLELERPTYNVELEVGYTELLALAIGLEALPFRDRFLGWDESDPADPRTIHDAAGTSLEAYAGIKAGQWPGAVAAVALMVLAAATF
jgi:hypothetical protein